MSFLIGWSAFFLDAFLYLYKKVYTSVGLSVHLSIPHELKLCKSAIFD